jgi:hypothetical protein
MREPNKYRVNNLLDMTEIPVGALPRFIDELPDILAQLREVRRTAPAKIMAIPKPRRLWWVPEGVFRRALARSFFQTQLTGYWVDDDKGEYTIGFSVNNERVREESGKLKGGV